MYQPDPEVPYMSESDGEVMLKEKYEQMVRNRQAVGKEVPVRIISESAIIETFIDAHERYGMTEHEAAEAGREYAHLAVEGSTSLIHKAKSRSFVVPELPWKKLEAKVKEALDVGTD